MLQRIRSAGKHDDGFTLIELLIVIVILGVLASIVVFGVAQFRTDSETAACNADLKTVQVAADAYDAQRGTYPDEMTDLTDDPNVDDADENYLAETPSNADAYSFDPDNKRVTRNC